MAKKQAERKISCPKCGSRQPDRGRDVFYFCDDCRMQFDLESDGGDYSDRDPAARMMREERQQQERRERLNARMGRRSGVTAYHFVVCGALILALGFSGARACGIPVSVYLPMMIIGGGIGSALAQLAWSFADWLSGK